MAGSRNDQLRELRKKLYPKIKNGSLHWHKVDLGFRAKVMVCSPASVSVTHAEVKEFDQVFPKLPATDPFTLFIPVTQKETWELAEHFDAFPLTRVVADRAHDQDGTTRQVKDRNFSATNTNQAYDFVTYSLNWLSKYGDTSNHLASGAHKLWLLSNTDFCSPSFGPSFPFIVNYGFYRTSKSSGGVEQFLGSCHPDHHWDYSQLLQLMRGLKINGLKASMARALLSGHPGVWGGDTGFVYERKKADGQLLGFDGNFKRDPPRWLQGWWKVTYWNGTKTEYYHFPSRGQKVQWSYTAPKKAGGIMLGATGSGYWIIKNTRLTISWKNTGSVDTWDFSDIVDVYVNMDYESLGLGLQDPIPITVNGHTGKAEKLFQ